MGLLGVVTGVRAVIHRAGRRGAITAPAAGVAGLVLDGLVVAAVEGDRAPDTGSSAASWPWPSGWSPPSSAVALKKDPLSS
ncbi:hypothetical protein [Nocardia beijingensis]|uniref:hypothetical protein n=1 Tax=Nocardia beijingensis TaxID=95162 RepID=UPI001E65CA8D|nr:hypothetical protein [Nocardia beijingensis]